MPQVLDSNGAIINGAFRPGDYGYGQLVAYTGTAGTVANPFWTNKATLTSTNVNVSNNDTVTIGGKVYTFKTALTPLEGEVLIGASADASLLNLIRALNHTGTPNTDYKVAAVDANVGADAAVSAAHSFQVYEKVGAASPGVAVSATAVTLSWNAANTSGGKTGEGLLAVMLSTAGYVAFGSAPTAVTTNIPMAAGVPQIFKVPTGYKVSAVQAAAGGNLTAVEVA
jgi:hypothetical protein